jgi:two-component system OmpR family response regulator
MWGGVMLVSRLPFSGSHRRTVLVVEDEFLLMDFITDHLRGTGLLVVGANSGEAAVALIDSDREVDLVFTDIRLGGKLNGWDVGEAWRVADPDIPLIYTSALSIEPSRQAAGSIFFGKPYDPREIASACLTFSGTP